MKIPHRQQCTSLPWTRFMWKLDTVGIHLHYINNVGVIGTHHMKSHLQGNRRAELNLMKTSLCKTCYFHLKSKQVLKELCSKLLRIVALNKWLILPHELT